MARPQLGARPCVVHAAALAIGAPGREWLTYGALRALCADVGAQLRSFGIGADARLVFITHVAKESDLQATVRQLRGMDVVKQVGGMLRVVGS